MNTNEQIEKTLNDDHNKYYEGVYAGKAPIPEDLIKLYKRGIRSRAPFAHKANFHRVKSIFNSKIEELRVRDLHEMIKVIMNTPIEKLYDNTQDDQQLNEAINDYLKVEKFIIEFNQMNEVFRNALELKRVKLQELAGTRTNGMRIIPQA